MHEDRIKLLLDLEKELRGLPAANHEEIQVAQNCAAMATVLRAAQAKRKTIAVAQGTGETAVK